MAALIPTIWPSMFTSGPPLLPGIHGGVGLQIFLIRAAADVVAAAARFGADDAERQAAVQAVRAAERPDEVADFELVAVAPLGGDQIVEVDFQNGDVGHRVGADDGRLGRAAVAEPDLDRFGAIDDVKVRDDVAGLVDDHAGALAVEVAPAERG